MKVLMLILLLVVNIQSASNFDLGILRPGPENSIEVVVNLNHDARQYEQHYVMFTSKNFGSPPIYLKTTDGKVVNYEPTRVPVKKHDPSYSLYLSSDLFVPEIEYQFTIHTYALNPNSGKIDNKTVQNLTYTFRIVPALTLEEVDLWNPPKTGEPWESSILSRHTLKVVSSEDWQLSLQGIKIVEGLRAVIFEKDPVVLTTHRNIPVTGNLTTIFDSPMTIGKPNNESIFTVIFYVEDYTIVPAGLADLEIYVEAKTLTDSRQGLNVK